MLIIVKPAPVRLMRLHQALAASIAFGLCLPARAANNPGVVCNGPVIREGASLPTEVDFDTTPTSPAINLAASLQYPKATGSYAKMNTTLGDIFIEFVNGATLSGNTTVAADTTVNLVKSYLASGSAADSSVNTYDGTFFHRSVQSSDFSIIQSGGFKIQQAQNGLRLDEIAPKRDSGNNTITLKNQFLAANTRGTLAMARTSDPDSATNQWFINVADNSAVFGTDNTGGYVVFARILGDGMKVVSSIAAQPTYDIDGSGSTLNEVPLYKYTAGSNLSLSNPLVVKTFRAVPASAVPAAARNPIITYSIVGNTNSAAVSATITKAGALTLKPALPGRSAVTIRAQVPSGHDFDYVITTTKSGPPVVVKAAPSSMTGNLGKIATIPADVTGWPFFIKWQYRTSSSAEWDDVPENTVSAFSAFVGTDTKELKVYLYGEVTEEAASSFALSGCQFRYLASNSETFDAPLSGSPITFNVKTDLGFKDTLAPTTTPTLGSTVTLTARATDFTLPYPTYRWQRLAPGSATWENLQDARAATDELPVVRSPYSGVTSANLTIRLDGTTPASGTAISTADTIALDKSRYRCVITHDRGVGPESQSSSETTLNIVIPQTITLVTTYSGLAFPGLETRAGRTFSVSKLPAGITMDPVTGRLYGTPSKKEETKAVITVRDNGAVTATYSCTLSVVELSGNNAGGFEALFTSVDDLSPPVAKLAINIASTGAFTGTLTTAEDPKPLTLKGTVKRTPEGTVSIAAPLSIKRSSGGGYVLSNVSITPEGVLSGTLSTLASPTAQPVTFGTAADGMVLGVGTAPWSSMSAFTFALTRPNNSLSGGPAYPRGSGYGRAPIDASGRLSLTGKLPDGAPLTASIPGGLDGSYRIFARPYGTLSGSYLVSQFKIQSTTPIQPNGSTFTRYAVAANGGEDTYWRRPNGVPKLAGYSSGFGPLGLSLKFEPWLFYNGTNLGLSFNNTGDAATIGVQFDGPILDNNGENPRGLPTTLNLTLGNLVISGTSSTTLNLNGGTGQAAGTLQISDTVSGSPVTRTVNIEGTFMVPAVDNYGANVPNGTVTFEGLAIIPPLPGVTTGPTTERVRFFQTGAAPSSP